MQAYVALITSQGIQFQNNFYTCPKAIREQWFNQTSPYYMVEIPVNYERDRLFLFLDSGEKLLTTKVHSNKLSQTELEMYFTKLNQLKLEIRTIKHEKS
ncbi:hypothetical protein FHS18_004193 [Paenibacillus phyllosphaerae]|uniref:Uncharacterized protein n=1 Tax=Paenibacillus phyllosphaerae TaxID=274593 RepID=A0A7W5B0F2_9BACL|nr:hypothetical protein [Paenibacillus phyllosphaerae]MBB3112115.1 hypothetical protein [Paenibacillus phyllosphaerae]